MLAYSIDGVTDLLHISRQHDIAIMTLNRPQVLNALNHEQRNNLEIAFKTLQDDPQIRVIILRGNGRSFCAGQDQKESAAMDAAGAYRRVEGYASLYTQVRNVNKPIIASIHGYAAGAGLQLALLADLRIASTDSKIGMTELNVGSAAIMGSALLFPLIGEARMRQLVMMSEYISSDQALSINLLHETLPHEDLDARSMAIAARLSQWPPLGVFLTKTWWRQIGDDLFFAAMEHARHSHAKNFAAGGLSAGAKAFLHRNKG